MSKPIADLPAGFPATPPRARGLGLKLKVDWLTYLHGARRRQMDLIFSRFPDRLFDRALELGAGDGYQSRLLTRYARHVVATELDTRHMPRQPSAGIEYRACDAEDVALSFPGERFDLIFSSNLLEHLPNVGRALRGMKMVLAERGVLIHSMPTPLWKLSHLLFHVPDQLLRAIEGRPASRRPDAVAASGRASVNEGDADAGPVDARENNLKVHRARRRSRLRRLLMPEPHGVSETHLQEFHAFRRARWERELTDAGFEILAVLKGPFYSGYGFGLDGWRQAAERFGLATEYVYVAARRAEGHPCLPFLPPR